MTPGGPPRRSGARRGARRAARRLARWPLTTKHFLAMALKPTIYFWHQTYL